MVITTRAAEKQKQKQPRPPTKLYMYTCNSHLQLEKREKQEETPKQSTDLSFFEHLTRVREGWERFKLRNLGWGALPKQQ